MVKKHAASVPAVVRRLVSLLCGVLLGSEGMVRLVINIIYLRLAESQNARMAVVDVDCGSGRRARLIVQA